jgi:hypothetical protein
MPRSEKNTLKKSKGGVRFAGGKQPTYITKAKEEKNRSVYRKYLCIFKAKEEKMENPFQFLHNVNECLLTLYKVTA